MVPKVTDYLGPPIRLTGIRDSNKKIRGALVGGLKDDSPADFWVLGSYASKTSSYYSLVYR